MDEIIPDKRPLVGLVEKAYNGEICLPNFQRDFVWPRDQVADLLRSVIRQYFIGSLLLLRCKPEKPPFAPEFLRGANAKTTQPHPKLLVLDGQQRLTAIMYALTAPDYALKNVAHRRWFFIDLNLVLSDPDNDAVVFDRTKKDLDGLDSSEVQFEQRVLPCTKLMRSKDFLKWRDGLDDWLRKKEPKNHEKFTEEWRDVWTKMSTDFQSFDIPLVELPEVEDGDAESLGRVCAIFEKLNSTGVELSVYDLLTARLYRSGLRLHDLWDEACAKNKLLKQWSGGKADNHKFGVLVLRTLALLRGLDPKPRILIDLKPDNFEKDWHRAASAMEEAIKLVTTVSEDGFGVFEQKWVTGYGLLPVLAALRSEITSRKLGEKPRADLRRWYWSNVFLERYSSAVESKSRKDYAEFLAHWVEGKAEPAVFVEARQRIGAAGFSVSDASSFANSMYCGIFALLAIAGARDWRRGENISLQELEDHHIFPRAYLKRHDLTKASEVNTILNRTLISDETNGIIKDKAPAEYLASKEVFPSGPKESLLAPHFARNDAIMVLKGCPEGLSKAELAEKYQEFRSLREATIIAKIREVCGVPAPG